MAYHKLIFRVHALRRMFERNISPKDVEMALEKGEVIAQYPEDKPCPSYLVLGFVRGRPLHIVTAEDSQNHCTIIVTVYEPDLGRWRNDFRRKN